MARKGKEPKPGSDPSNLLERAEDLWRKSARENTSLPARNLEARVHELQVHQIELEMQNEELQTAQAERDKYLDLFDFAPLAYLTLDANGVILEGNLSASNLLGLERSKFKGREFSGFIARPSLDAWSRHIKAVRQTSAQKNCRLLLQIKSDSTRWVRLDSVLIPSDSAAPSQIRIAILDITELVAAESAMAKLNIDLDESLNQRSCDLHAALDRLKLLGEAMTRLGEGVLITDGVLDLPAAKILYVNEAMCRITGYREDELIGRTPRLLRQGLDTDREVRERMRRGLSSGKPFSVELVNYRKDGTPYDTEMFITPLCDAEGHRTHFVAIHRDITEVKQARIDVWREHELNESIINTMPHIVLLLDLQGRIVRFNPFLEQLAGWKLEDVKGRSWFQTFLPSRDRKRIRQLFQRVLAGERILGHPNPILTKEGQERLIEWHNATLSDHQDNLVGLVCIGQDVTERNELQRRIALEHSITQLLSKSLAVDQTIPEVLRLVGTKLDWHFGEMWEPDPSSLVLRHSFLWGRPRLLEGPFGIVTRQTAFRPGEGHIGQVWRDGRPRWSSDLKWSSRFSRVAAARTAGLHSLLAFPISTEGKVIGVMAFFSAKQRAPDAGLLKLVKTIGKQLGNFIRRRRAEESLREREARLATILNTASDAIITINQQGLIVGLNPATERMFGYEADELMGQNIRILMPAPYHREHDDYLARYHRTGEARIIGVGREVMAQRKDGSILPVFLSVSEASDLGFFTGILHDISERRQFQRQIVQAADEQQRRIAQDLHDGLGSHLYGIALYSQSLVRELQLRDIPEAKDAARLAKLTGEAFEQCRQVARGLHPVESAPEGLTRALENLAAEKRSSGIQCRVNIPVPVPIGDVTVANHLFHIAQEAVHNAIRHGLAKHVEIRLRQTEDCVELRIRDNGRGLPGESPAATGGLGWKTMAYRASLINGILEIRSAPRGGVEVLCRVRTG